VKKVLFIGWWQGKNEGDNYLRLCMDRFFSAKYEVVFTITEFPINEQTLSYLNSFYAVAVGPGGLFTKYIFKPFNTFNEWMNHLKVPLFFIGVSVENEYLYDKVVRTSIIDKSERFIVRDELSQKECSNKKVEILPDISFLYPRKINRFASSFSKIALNFRNGNGSEKFESFFKYIKKSYDIAPVPLSFHSLYDDRIAMKSLYKNIFMRWLDRKFEIQKLASANLAIGMRLHFLIFAIQNGIPLLFINYNQKVGALFNEIEKKSGESFSSYEITDLNDYEKIDDMISLLNDKTLEISNVFENYTNESQLILEKELCNVFK